MSDEPDDRGDRERSGREDRGPARSHPGHSGRRGRRGEARLPAAVAVLVAVALYGLLPGSLLPAPRWVVPGLEVAFLAAVSVANPWRMTRDSRWSRSMSIALALLIIVSNLVALGLLVTELTTGAGKHPAGLLVAGLQVWATDVIAFGLLFWELDRGGPVARTQLPRERLPLADFRFSQDEDRDTVVEVSDGGSARADWVPTFADYLYVSTTNSSAFSPTDTMPLSTRAKLLMGVEATSALMTTLLIVAYAVGSL